MTRRDLLKKYDELNQDNYRDYANKYLVQHWQEESNSKELMNLVSDHFANFHIADGTITENKAVDMCLERSGYGANNFISTILPEKFVVKIAQYIAKNIIEWHGNNRRDFNFTNYLIPVSGTMFTVKYDAKKQKFLPTQFNDQVVVGINRQGLIVHFHGDVQYADGAIYGVDGDKIKKLRE